MADSIAIALSMIAAAFVRGVVLDRPEAIGPIALTGVLALPIWLCVFARYKLYSAAAVSSQTAEIRRVVHAIAFAVACTGLITFALAQNVSRVWLVMTFAAALAIVTAERAVTRGVFRRIRSQGNLERRVVVIGSNREALGIVHDLRADPALGYRVLGLITPDGTTVETSAAPVLGTSSDTVEIVQAVRATGVIVAASAVEPAVANRLARELIEIGCHVELTSGLVDISTDRLLTRPLARRPVMYIQPVRRAGWRAVAKRVFDVAVATALLVLTAPLLAVTAILIKLDSAGPVLFAQVRVGKGGGQFRLLKFRTMVADAETMIDLLREQNEMEGPLFKMREDPRVTRVGRVLRNFSIDELPQLWNVIRGEMSIVGPRPALPTEASSWTDEQRNRVSVKPGITGMWQVNGRSESSFDDYVRHDLYYVDNWSLLTDLAIVAKTIPTVLLRRGAY